MTTFWLSNQNKVLLETLIYGYLRDSSLELHKEPTILSQLCIDSNEWQCIKSMMGQKIPCSTCSLRLRKQIFIYRCMMSWDCLRGGYKTCIVISNDTDVIVALLFYVPTFLQEGLQELWVKAGRGNTTRFFLPIFCMKDWALVCAQCSQHYIALHDVILPVK